MPKEINKKLTEEQKKVMFDEGTEMPGSSILNNEKRDGSYHCVNCEIKLFDSKKNMKVVQVGHLFMNHCLIHSKQKQIIF